jgi:hypothetical protein
MPPPKPAAAERRALGEKHALGELPTGWLEEHTADGETLARFPSSPAVRRTTVTNELSSW